MKKRTCRRLQEILAEQGPRALQRDEAAQRHLTECTECFDFLEALAELDETLPTLSRPDAPDEVVDRLLARPELAARAAGEGGKAEEGAGPPPAEPPAVAPSSGGRLPTFTALMDWFAYLWQRAWFKTALACGVTLLLMVIVFPSYKEKASFTETARRPIILSSKGLKAYAHKPRTRSSGEEARKKEAVSGSDAGRPETDGNFGGDVQPLQPEILEGREQEESLSFESPATPPAEAPRRDLYEGRVNDRLTETTLTGQLQDGMADLEAGSSTIPETSEAGESLYDYSDAGLAGERSAAETGAWERGAEESGVGAPTAGVLEGDKLARQAMTGDNPYIDTLRSSLRTEVEKTKAEQERNEETRSSLKTLGYLDDEAEYDEKDNREPAKKSWEPDANILLGEIVSGPWHDFVLERSTVEGLHFKEAAGYWSNTYVPGDPAFRLLQARVLAGDRSVLSGFSRAPLSLDDGVRQTSQPFDPPENAALAVYLHADHRGLSGPERMLVQVGLKATSRRSGHRPAMNVGVVLDLRGPVSPETGQRMRALVDALAREKDLGDRFCLLAAGRPGGLVVEPDRFRHGPLRVRMAELFGDQPKPGRSLDLEATMALAMETVGRSDDPTAPLGSSVVILVTAQAIGPGLESLVDLAHRSAVGGIPVSVVGIGDQVQPVELDRLILAGQGNRRLMADPADAGRIVESELSAVGRVVARAVRLRIRLAPGVRLVDVVGSSRLDETRAQHVREAEQSIDRRMARNLGITADRGEDEEGIQIVIPSFYAGDAHTVLLDVVAPGPGAVADVTVRFKDMVYLRNGVARANLSLGRDRGQLGPLELNVIKNLAAYRLSRKLEQAGDLVAAGDPEAALRLLVGQREFLDTMRCRLTGMENDRDLIGDINMLAEYMGLIGAGAAGRPESRGYLADSLRLAGRLKVLPRPVIN